MFLQLAGRLAGRAEGRRCLPLLQVVSSDFITDTHSSIVDAKAGIQLSPTFVKVLHCLPMSVDVACCFKPNDMVRRFHSGIPVPAAHQLVRQRVGLQQQGTVDTRFSACNLALILHSEVS